MRDLRIGLIDLLVYYEIPAEGKREEVKRKFENFVARNQKILQQKVIK